MNTQQKIEKGRRKTMTLLINKIQIKKENANPHT